MTDSTAERNAIERALMDRVRAHVAREQEPPPRRWLQHALALGAALALVAIVMFGFDAFLTAMQRFMEAEITDPAPTEPVPAGPVPIYVVPGDVSPPPTADQDPRPSPAPAPDTSPAIP